MLRLGLQLDASSLDNTSLLSRLVLVCLCSKMSLVIGFVLGVPPLQAREARWGQGAAGSSSWAVFGRASASLPSPSENFTSGRDV